MNTTSKINLSDNQIMDSKAGKSLVVIISSTGGPKALQSVIPKLPKQLAAPVLVVQHMVDSVTGTLANRLDALSAVTVKEAAHGEYIKNGVVYIAKGGIHLTVDGAGANPTVFLDDSEAVGGLKPCGDKLLVSLENSIYDEIVCVILTGMGCDGSAGIRQLLKSKKLYVIAQDEKSSTVYGMPKNVQKNGYADCVCNIEDIAEKIIRKAGVC